MVAAVIDAHISGHLYRVWLFIPVGCLGYSFFGKDCLGYS